MVFEREGKIMAAGRRRSKDGGEYKNKERNDSEILGVGILVQGILGVLGFSF